MAKFNSTTFGEISGRHGSAVAAITKEGKCILKVFRAPSNPNTEKQISHRSKFGLVNSELSKLQNLFTITFGSKQGKSHAVSLAMANAITGEYPDFAIDYSQLIMAEGIVDQTELVSAEKAEGTKVKVDWDTTVSTESSEMDSVNLIFMNAASKIAVLKQDYALRNAGTANVELPAVWAGAEIHCWIYFFSESGSGTSTSQYIARLQM